MVNSFIYFTAMMALWAIVFENRVFSDAGNIIIPFKEIYIIFTYLCLAPALGYILKVNFPTYFKMFWKYLPFLTIFTLLLQLITESVKAYYITVFVTGKAFFMAVCLVASGFLLSGSISFISRQPTNRLIAIILDAGVRNTFVSHIILCESLQPPESDYTRTVPALASILSMLSSCFAICVFKCYKRCNQTKYSLAEGSDTMDEDRNTCSSISSQQFADLKITAV